MLNIGPFDVIHDGRVWVCTHEQTLAVRFELSKIPVDPVPLRGNDLSECAAVNVLTVAGYEIKSPMQLSQERDASNKGVDMVEAAKIAQEEASVAQDLQKCRDEIEDLSIELADVKLELEKWRKGEHPTATHPAPLPDLGPSAWICDRCKEVHPLDVDNCPCGKVRPGSPESFVPSPDHDPGHPMKGMA